MSDDLEWTEEEEELINCPIASYPIPKKLLSVQEEIYFCNRAQSGDQSARETMTMHNMRLVIKIAHRYRGRATLDVEDLVQEGVIGLLTAINKFDGNKGYKFSTYATYWVRQAINRAIENHGRNIRVPSHLRQLERKFDQARYSISLQTGKEPTIEEICEWLDVTEAQGRSVEKIPIEPLSLDYLIGDELDSTLVDLLPADPEDDPERIAMRGADRAAMLELISCLREREQLVIERRFGFHDGRPWTLMELAQELGISREGVRQIEARALRQLRRIAGEME